MTLDFDNLLQQSVDIWLHEDIGSGDQTTLATIPSGAEGSADLLAKDEGILAGIFIVKKVIELFDKKLNLDVLIPDGSFIRHGDIVFRLSGPVASILQVERLCLNLLQRLSGIATSTHIYADKLKDYKTRILDTRKTTPGMRFLEKEAVRLGGGINHRFGLYDMILIKDNHIDFAGGIQKALMQARSYLDKNKLDIKIEVETRSLDEIRLVLETGLADRILLDNFSPELTRKAVELINGKAETESSGGISLETLCDYAECGVDYISVGALTHQIHSLDLSLKASF